MNAVGVTSFSASLGENLYLVCNSFRDVLYVHVRKYEGHFPTKIGVGLTLSRWKALNQHVEEINRQLDEKAHTFDRHLGGNYYVVLENERIDVRKWWMNEECVLKPSRKGINLSRDQWSELTKRSIELNEVLGVELENVTDCFHANQESFYACHECCPDGLIH